MNLLLGFVVLVCVVCSQQLISTRTVAEFYEGSSTQQSGLQVGDTIVAVNGRRCFIANDIIYEFARTQQGQADLTVLRDGKRVQLDNVVFDTYEENGVNQLVIDFKVLGEKKTVLAFLTGLPPEGYRVSVRDFSGRPGCPPIPVCIEKRAW